jgi:hypothetical protein
VASLGVQRDSKKLFGEVENIVRFPTTVQSYTFFHPFELIFADTATNEHRMVFSVDTFCYNYCDRYR